jgi:hypothetical protein
MSGIPLCRDSSLLTEHCLSRSSPGRFFAGCRAVDGGGQIASFTEYSKALRLSGTPENATHGRAIQGTFNCRMYLHFVSAFRALEQRYIQMQSVSSKDGWSWSVAQGRENATWKSDANILVETLVERMFQENIWEYMDVAQKTWKRRLLLLWKHLFPIVSWYIYIVSVCW